MLLPSIGRSLLYLLFMYHLSYVPFYVLWMIFDNSTKIDFVDLKSNSALLYNKGHNFQKILSTRKIPQNWIFPKGYNKGRRRVKLHWGSNKMLQRNIFPHPQKCVA